MIYFFLVESCLELQLLRGNTRCIRPILYSIMQGHCPSLLVGVTVAIPETIAQWCAGSALDLR